MVSYLSCHITSKFCK